MKGYYLFAPIQKGNLIGPYSGVERKIRSQCAALGERYDVTLDIRTAEYGLLQKICARLPFFSTMGRGLKYSGECDDCGFLYIRHRYIDNALVRYLRKVKKRNPDIKIIYEIPTYPYDAERKLDLSNFYIALKDNINRKKLRKYVDRIATFYGQTEIFGVKTLTLQNGFDFSTCDISADTPDISDGINVIEVSITAYWHGYDRFIEGLRQYYEGGGKENVIFHMVGPVLDEHKKLVEAYNLQDHVVFHGKMPNNELDAVYKPCVLGVDVLGGHRKDYPVSSSLKSREFAARGLPFITSSPVDYIEDGYKYQYIAPYDDSPVDVKSVLEFVHSYMDGGDFRSVQREIRDYGMRRIGISTTMRPVFDFIDGKTT